MKEDLLSVGNKYIHNIRETRQKKKNLTSGHNNLKNLQKSNH